MMTEIIAKILATLSILFQSAIAVLNNDPKAIFGSALLKWQLK